MVGTRPSRVRTDATVGKILARARLRKNISLDTAAATLRIPPKHLTALEEGDLSVFAAEVYARGAFRKYAEYLGVRAEGTQRAFLRVLSGAREYVPLHVYTPKPWLTRLLTPRRVLAAAVALIALVVGSYIVWQVQSFLRLPALEILEPTSAIIAGSTLTVRGQAAPNARVVVNDASVLLSDKGTFETTLVLHPGINVLRVEAENAAGRKRTITRDLLMPRRLLPGS